MFLLFGAQSANAAYIVVDTGHTPQHLGATGANGRVEYLYNLDMSRDVSEDLIAMDGAKERREYVKLAYAAFK